AIRESINLTPDLRTNTVIVSAPRESMRMIEQMIRDIDASNMGAQNVRIFKLENADALAMAEILTDLFNLARQGNLYVLKPREAAPTEDERELGAALETVGIQSYATLDTAELTAVPDDRQQLSLTVDNRTNSLLVTGTPAYLDLVSTVVEELDALEATEREVFVYQLRNAVAAEVASVVSSFVEQEQQKLISTLGAEQIGSAARLLEREITIVGDDASNTVLVSTSPRYMERVKAMIAELDVDPPQVLIQVLVAEVTLDSLKEWAPDVSGEFRAGSATVAGSSGLGVLGSAFINALGVPSLSVTTTDFDLLLRALETQGRLQVLSNPSVMAANNQPARIQVGENIGRASSTSLSDGGTQQTIVEFLDIGTILEVTPSINPDGFVRMVIMPEFLDLTNRTTQVSEDLEVPILTKRTATTTVTVRDGQTIVLGGLISDQYEQRERKVPFLGDIPLVGLLFRSELEETTKTELLIVLTPHVITSPAELSRVNYLTDREIDRLSLSAEQKASLRRGLVERHDETNPPAGDEQ
ncbi:MAG: secretin N-terminal domain-containing protein, partial [Planctomycetota bacterium]